MIDSALSDEALIEKARGGDPFAADALARRYEPLCSKLAKKVYAPLEPEDRLAWARFGVALAINKYDGRAKFITLAYTQIVFAIKRGYREKIRADSGDYNMKREPFGFVEYDANPMRYQRPDEMSLKDFAKADDRIVIALLKLDDREKVILEELSTNERSMADIARRLHLSRQRVDQIMKAIKGKVRYAEIAA